MLMQWLRWKRKTSAANPPDHLFSDVIISHFSGDFQGGVLIGFSKELKVIHSVLFIPIFWSLLEYSCERRSVIVADSINNTTAWDAMSRQSLRLKDLLITAY